MLLVLCNPLCNCAIVTWKGMACAQGYAHSATHFGYIVNNKKAIMAESNSLFVSTLWSTTWTKTQSNLVPVQCTMCWSWQHNALCSVNTARSDFSPVTVPVMYKDPELKLDCSVIVTWGITSLVAGWQWLDFPRHKGTWAILLLPYRGPSQAACHMLVSHLVDCDVHCVLWST